jgi:hypothetical protein
VLKVKQYFCKHNFQFIAHHNCTQQNLWKCSKCGVFIIQHYGIGTHYKCKEPNIDGWIYEVEVNK